MIIENNENRNKQVLSSKKIFKNATVANVIRDKTCKHCLKRRKPTKYRM